MNLRIAKLCLDCDEVMDEEVSACPVCASRSLIPLVNYVKPLPQLKVREKNIKKKRRKAA